MADDRSLTTCEVTQVDPSQVERRVERRRRIHLSELVVGPWSYQFKVGRGTIRLSTVEYRILMFLAARPYHAFTRRSIAEAVTSENDPVTVDTLSRYVTSLRRQLGFYADLIQSVPYIGYRFKA